MSIVTFFKRLFRKTKKYEVWDTSAISNHFDEFKEELRNADDKIIVVPEGVNHEIYYGKKRGNLWCRYLYNFINANLNNSKLIIGVTPDKARNWEVDEQVVCIAELYSKRGFDVKLVTSDHELSGRAKLKNLETKYMIVDKEKNKKCYVPQNVENVPKVVSVSEQNKVEHVNLNIQEEVALEATKNGKFCILNTTKYISVIDRRGFNKIPRNGTVQVTKEDTVLLKGNAYCVKEITEQNLLLARVR